MALRPGACVGVGVLLLLAGRCLADGKGLSPFSVVSKKGTVPLVGPNKGDSPHFGQLLPKWGQSPTAPPTLEQRLEDATAFAGSQLLSMAAGSGLDSTHFPCYAEPGRPWFTQNQHDWVAGLFPGSLWILAELTGDSRYVPYAQTWSNRVDTTSSSTGNIGFSAFAAFKTWYDFDGDANARSRVIAAAQRELATYVPLPDAGGGRPGSRGLFVEAGMWQPYGSSFPASSWAATYVDQLMSIQAGLWAAAQTGDADMYAKNVLHARTAFALLARPDGGSHHWAYVNLSSGGGATRQYQGYDDTTTWSRGQAWMIHGMADVAKAAGQAGDAAVRSEFLAYAQAAADYWLDNPNLPADGIPYWDFSAPAKVPAHQDRDSSAAAVAASAFIDLCRLADDPADRDRYLDAARLILTSLSTPIGQGGYLNELSDGTPAGNGILAHAVYAHSYSEANGHSGEYTYKVTDDAAVIWGDYFYLEAVQKYEQVPEPASLALLALGGLGVLARRRVGGKTRHA